jgi:hypothetical protein
MFNLSEYRNKPQNLADFLPWAALVEEGVVLNKDGRLAENPNKMGTSSLAWRDVDTTKRDHPQGPREPPLGDFDWRPQYSPGLYGLVGESLRGFPPVRWSGGGKPTKRTSDSLRSPGGLWDARAIWSLWAFARPAIGDGLNAKSPRRHHVKPSGPIGHMGPPRSIGTRFEVPKKSAQQRQHCSIFSWSATSPTQCRVTMLTIEKGPQAMPTAQV